MLTDGVIKRLTEEDFNELIRRPVMQYIDAAAVEAMAEPFTVLDVKCPLNFAAVITPAPSICPGPPARSIKRPRPRQAVFGAG